MKFKNYILKLVILIAILSLICSFIGIFSNDAGELKEITSVYGETVELYGKGIYKNDSISAVSQGKAQDIVTIIFGIPLLIFSAYKFNKKSLKGLLVLTGTLGYFLYTYMSYTFLWNYNILFLAYVILMSASIFAFILCICSINISNLKSNFSDKLPVKIIGSFQIIVGIMIGLMWLGRIMPTITTNTAPTGLEHYTTLVIQGMDLGLIVPLSIFSGISLIKKMNIGYLLSSVVIIKGLTMLTSITSMIISMLLAGVSVSIIEIILFPLFNICIIYLFYILIKSVHGQIETS